VRLVVRGAVKRPATVRELLSRLGRGMLWLAVAAVLVRGLVGILDAESRPANVPPTPPASTWPDDAARAYAIEFATAYLTITPDDPTTLTAVAEMAAPGIADALAPALDSGAVAQQVESAAVADVRRVDARRALITVTARVRSERHRTVRLTVPVARDARGALVVNDLPSLAPAPMRADVGPIDGTPILGADRAAIVDVLTRFLRAYLAGDRAGLAYLVPAGTRIAASSGGFELRELGSIAATGPERGRERLVLVRAHVRDRVSRAIYALRYRVRLVRRDRWYVAELNGPQEG
jgi:hypothetical protein